MLLRAVNIQTLTMSKRFLLYVVIIVATFLVILYIRNPELLSKLWLWVVGLFGVAAGYAESLWKGLKSKVLQVVGNDQPSTIPPTRTQNTPSPAQTNVTSQPDPRDKERETAIQQQVTDLQGQLIEKDKNIAALNDKVNAIQQPAIKPVDPFTGTNIYLLRYLDDGETTLGLLYLDNKFFCYTLEDTFRAVKVAAKTRIPAGDYLVLFNKTLTKLTQKYRDKPFTKGWFTWHLHLQNVPGFDGIYIHSGGDSGDTEGCILVSDGLDSSDHKKTFTNSKKTFEIFYKQIAEDLEANVPVRIRIYDEHWFNNEILNPS